VRAPEAFRQPFSKDPEVDRSLRHSLWDGVTYSLMSGAGESYFSAFGLLVKATTAQIGVLASLPPLIASFMQLLSVWLGRVTGQRKWIIVFGALVQATALGFIVVLPASYPEHAFWILLACVVVYFAGPHLGTPQWGSLMGDLVPESRRGRYFALRTRLASISSFSALIGAGLTLQVFDGYSRAYQGFVAIFVFAMAARLASAYHLARMLDPPRRAAPERAGSDVPLWRRLRHSELLKFSLFFACMQFAVAVASPFFVVYMLRDLQFTYLEWTINSACSVCFQFLTLNRWGRLSDLFGNRLILLTTGCLMPFLPTLWVVSTDFYYLLAVQAVSGLVWAGFTLSATNFVFDLTPAHRRAILMAGHNVLAALAVFSGALLGGYLGTHLPADIVIRGEHYQWTSALYGVFIASTLLRLLMAALFLPRLKEVRRIKPMTMSGVIFRVTRLHPLSGVIFDVINFRQRREPPEKRRERPEKSRERREKRRERPEQSRERPPDSE